MPSTPLPQSAVTRERIPAAELRSATPAPVALELGGDGRYRLTMTPGAVALARNDVTGRYMVTGAPFGASALPYRLNAGPVLL
jgi:hypothetical protein